MKGQSVLFTAVASIKVNMMHDNGKFCHLQMLTFRNENGSFLCQIVCYLYHNPGWFNLHNSALELLLLPWINFNLSMDK